MEDADKNKNKSQKLHSSLDVSDEDDTLDQLVIKEVNESLQINVKGSLFRKYLNTFTGILINSFNCIVFLLSYKYYSLTQYLIIIIILNILVYLLLYFSLKKID